MVKVEVVMDEKALHERHMLDLKLIKLSWALFFILIGGTWMLDSMGKINDSQKWGIFYAGFGSILLFLNLMRIIWKMNISRFTTWLGIIGLLFGISKYFEFALSVWALAFVIIGLIMLFEVFRK